MISKISINCNYIWYIKKIDYFKLIKSNHDISYNATLKQTRSSFYRNANSKREICKRNTNQQNRELPTNWIKTMGQHANGQKTQQQLLLKRAQWHNSNNDFPFFGPKKRSKKWEAIRCSPLRDSLSGLFGLPSSGAMPAETYN